MMMFDIWRQIENKQFKQLYLLFGTESFLIHETIQLLINNVLNEDEKDFNLSTYDLEETPIEVALEDAETFPFIGEKRLIILQNPVFLTSEKTKEKIDHQLYKLEEFLVNPSPYSIVVIAAPYEKLDDRKKITKELKRKAATIEAKKLNEQDLRKWINDKAFANGVQIEEKAIEKMISIAGTNLFVLTSEMDKMSLFVGNEKKIDLKTVEMLVSKTLEQNIFELVDKVVHRKIEEALRIYYDLLKQNEEPLKILALLAGQFRLIYQVKELARKGYGQQQMASTLKQHPFRVKLAAGQANLFMEDELRQMMLLFAEADYQMKTSSLNKTMVIEMIFFKLSTLSQKK